MLHVGQGVPSPWPRSLAADNGSRLAPDPIERAAGDHLLVIRPLDPPCVVKAHLGT